uniref:Uncharacterized protein n=1 Tax=Mycena chlorophos TaxID=658473 RepID=A0ABQ0LEX2_MYCCL|nr:predicted protein [Mycena chlorophos]
MAPKWGQGAVRFLGRSGPYRSGTTVKSHAEVLGRLSNRPSVDLAAKVHQHLGDMAPVMQRHAKRDVVAGWTTLRVVVAFLAQVRFPRAAEPTKGHTTRPPVAREDRERRGACGEAPSKLQRQRRHPEGVIGPSTSRRRRLWSPALLPATRPPHTHNREQTGTPGATATTCSRADKRLGLRRQVAQPPWAGAASRLECGPDAGRAGAYAQS